jgi:CRISPR/Cas system endoribonuclease Cas6 (RAMP superfamily)
MNQINRHNYETYFLLYADNELSASEKKIVDEFVQSNPDLEEELVLLLQTILQKVEMPLKDKTALHKNETLSADVLEQLLLHLDNELAEPKKAAILALLSSSPVVSREWSLLQSTRLFSESHLVFEEKQSLYRRQKDKPVLLPWRKLMAAAMVIGIGLWGYIFYMNASSKHNYSLISKQENRIDSTIMNKPPSNFLSHISADSAIAAKANQNGQSLITQASFTKRSLTHPAIGSFSSTASTMKSLPASPPANLALIVFSEKIDPVETGKIIASNLLTVKQDDRLKQLRENGIVINESMGNSFISTTSFVDNEVENNNQVLFVGEEKISKTSLGVLFKKIKRVIERNIHPNSTDKNFKVANFEFAIY